MTLNGSASAPGGPAPARLHMLEEGPASHDVVRRAIETSRCGAYELFIAVPKTGGERAAVLYMLDGNAAFDELTAPMLEAHPRLAVVGIGYDTPLRFDVVRRNRDYTPPTQPGHPAPDPARPDRIIGGADIFLDALVNEIMPQAERLLPGAPLHRTLWGHSLAGLCTLYCLLTRPRAFDRYIAVSPSLWWADGFMARRQEAFAPPSKLECLVMLSDSEKRSSPSGPHWDGPSPHTLRFVETLGKHRDVSARLDIFPGLAHATTLPRSLEASLDFAARPR